MIFLRRLHRWLRALPLKERFEGELSEEFRFHLESMIEANMQAGMSQGEARRAALGRFGNPDQAKEGCRDARVLHFLEALWRDALVALRPEGFPRLEQANIDGRVAGFTLLLSLITVLLFGLIPALRVSRMHRIEQHRVGALAI